MCIRDRLRDVNEHFVDGHVEAGDDMCGVEYIDSVLELADFAFKFFLTFLRVGIEMCIRDRLHAEKLALKMLKSLDKSRLFAWASFLVPSYGATDGT